MLSTKQWTTLKSKSYLNAVALEMHLKGMTMQDMAYKTGYDLQWLERLFAGKVQLTIGAMSKLACALDIKLKIDLLPIPEGAISIETETSEEIEQWIETTVQAMDLLESEVMVTA